MTILTRYDGISVDTMTRLRRMFRDADVEMKVFKNTLSRIAADNAGFPDLRPVLEGSTAFVFSQDPIVPARIIRQFTRECPQLVVKGAVYEGRVITREDVAILAVLPPREIMLAYVAAGVQSPLSAFVNVLQGTIRSLVTVLSAAEKKMADAA
jgi:large subunit ribosomal protein L10